MKQLRLFIDLARLNKPIGFMLLFWPCAWGLTISYDFTAEKFYYLYYLTLFLVGAILMRSAGCIVNDIADRNFDKKVYRTKDRPIATGKISVMKGIVYTLILCVIALLVLMQFNNITIILALLSMPLAFTYPLMKRLTYWPQLFLGITFNYGLLLGWTAIKGQIDLIALLFYFGAIFWTLGYDTIYGFQDIKEDEIIGLKSTSIKFKNSPKKFLMSCYGLFLINLLIISFLMKFNNIFYLFYIFILFQMFYFQIKKLDIKNHNNCLNIFKSNNYLGLIILISLVGGKI